jgi:hypothetical protein
VCVRACVCVRARAPHAQSTGACWTPLAAPPRWPPEQTPSLSSPPHHHQPTLPPPCDFVFDCCTTSTTPHPPHPRARTAASVFTHVRARPDPFARLWNAFSRSLDCLLFFVRVLCVVSSRFFAARWLYVRWAARLLVGGGGAGLGALCGMMRAVEAARTERCVWPPKRASCHTNHRRQRTCGRTHVQANVPLRDF